MSTSGNHQKRPSIRDFLSNAHEALSKANNNGENITIVTGNESADLDSLTSSLLYAYIRTNSSSRTTYIPLINIPRADLALRPEFTALLSHANVSTDDLISLDDVSSLLQPEQTRWVLVDHNALQGKLGEKFGGEVVGCIDHHVDEGKVPNDSEEKFGEPRVIKKTGSCTSLVVQHLEDAWDELSSSNGNAMKESDAQIARLGMGSILIDTMDLQNEYKTTDDDKEAVTYLEKRVRAAKGGEKFDRHEIYEEIDAAKKNLEPLRVRDVLRKDYKEWQEGDVKIGVSAMVKPIVWIKKKASAEEKTEDGTKAALDQMRVYAEERGLTVFALMTTSTDDVGTFRRELLVWALRKEVVDVVKRFEETSTDELGLEPWNVNGDMNEDNGEALRKVWYIRKTENSRKQVAPLLRKAVSS